MLYKIETPAATTNAPPRPIHTRSTKRPHLEQPNHHRGRAHLTEQRPPMGGKEPGALGVAEKALKVAENRAKSAYFRKQERSSGHTRNRASRAGGDTTHREPASRHRASQPNQEHRANPHRAAATVYHRGHTTTEANRHRHQPASRHRAATKATPPPRPIH